MAALDLEPGVYRATVHGVPDTIVILIASTQVDPWLSINEINGLRGHMQKDVTDARPLIVLDLNDWQRRHVIDALEHADPDTISARQILDALIDQIEAQTKPRRMTEPGWFGIVAAGDEMRDNWMHYRIGGDEQWMCPDTTEVATWHDLINPTPIRDGIEADRCQPKS